MAEANSGTGSITVLLSSLFGLSWKALCHSVHAAYGTASVSGHFPDVVRKGVDWEAGELDSVLDLCATGQVISLLSGPQAPHLYTEGFHWVMSNVTHDHCLSLERQVSIVIKISGSGRRLIWL